MSAVSDRARAIKGETGCCGVRRAVLEGRLERYQDVSVCEALLLGLIEQDVRNFFVLLGHGSTPLGEVLRVYAQMGVIEVRAVHNEGEAAHAATAARLLGAKKVGVVCSIGPGAMHAMAASLSASANGVGVWHIYGDVGSEGEGLFLQQLPDARESAYAEAADHFGSAYRVATPWSVLRALEKGLIVTEHPVRAKPYFVLLALDVQEEMLRSVDLAGLPCAEAPMSLGPAPYGAIESAVDTLMAAERIAVKIGGGALRCGRAALLSFLDTFGGVAVPTPRALGLVPYSHQRYAGVGGSKGTPPGNYAMEHADCLVVVGSRPVCQADMSRTGYPRVERVVNINGDPDVAMHYRNTSPLIGDIEPTLRMLVESAEVRTPREVRARRAAADRKWLAEVGSVKEQWQRVKRDLVEQGPVFDSFWGRSVLTEVEAIWGVQVICKSLGVPIVYDAGDVQANGFQVAEDEEPWQTLTETGASFMGFAPSAVLATAIPGCCERVVALCGDGSLMMYPQILLDGVEHGARGVIVVVDNASQGAIASLQLEQYGSIFATTRRTKVDFTEFSAVVPGLRTAGPVFTSSDLQKAVKEGCSEDALMVIHVPVTTWAKGDASKGSVGSFGRWNVGPWCTEVRETARRSNV